MSLIGIKHCRCVRTWRPPCSIAGVVAAHEHFCHFGGTDIGSSSATSGASRSSIWVSEDVRLPFGFPRPRRCRKRSPFVCMTSATATCAISRHGNTKRRRHAWCHSSSLTPSQQRRRKKSTAFTESTPMYAKWLRGES